MKVMVSVIAALFIGALVAANSFAELTTGVALYNMECVSCHGPLAASAKLGATEAMIQNAISTNYGGMGFLSTLTIADLQEIANALALPSTPAPAPVPGPAPLPVPAPVVPAPGAVDGAALYNSDCSICHGALASSAVSGKSAQTIQAAISNNTGGMGQFLNLTQVQVAAIATALGAPSAGLTPGTGTGTGSSGEALYTSNCSSCHGPLATSAKAQATVAGIQNAIKTNQGGMSSLSALTPTDIVAISSALATSKGAGGGGMTKGLSCSACHGTNVPGGSSGGGD